MKPIVLAFAATILAGALTPADALTLKRAVTVGSDVVRVGDFFTDASEHKDTALFHAPEPGSRGVVSTERLSEAVRRLGIAWLPPLGLRQVEVTRIARSSYHDIPEAVVEAKIGERLAEMLTGPADVDDLVISLNAGAPTIVIEGDGGHRIDVAQISVDEARGRFDAVVELVQGSRNESYEFNGRFERYYDVPVLSASLSRGEVVTADDLSETRMRDPAAGTVMNEADIIGFAARRSLRAGVPLRASDIEPPKLVTRNQLVTIVFSMPGITLTTQGRALADGADGETVSVLNVRSNRIVQAMVVEPGLVRVGEDSTRTAMR